MTLPVMGAVTAWAVPGSAAVTARPAQHRPGAAAAAAGTTSCDPTASLRPAGPPQVTPGSSMAKIRARGYLIAGVDQSTYHFGYLNPLDGKIEGFDIDMVHAIAARRSSATRTRSSSRPSRTPSGSPISGPARSTSWRTR